MVAAAEQSPYSGQELRQIHSLSDKEIEALQHGDGMGFAKLAELNHYPGPRHVLDLAEQLGLSASQVDATKQLYEEMHSKAVAYGEQLLAAESNIDHAFMDGSISTESLEAALLDIGKIRAQLRFVHLESHLRQTAILTREQISLYDTVRGYKGGEHHHSANTAIHGGDSSLPDPLQAGWKGASVCERLFENSEQRILRCEFPPGAGHERHFHSPHFGYAVAGGRMQITDSGGVRELDLPTGSSYSSKGVDWHEVFNVGDTMSTYLIVESKQQPLER
jgi:quercetin dioxygenase-like cupin family protein